MVLTCDIELDNKGTYFAGKMLTGKITLKTDKLKKIKGVSLKVKGFAHTSWTESNSSTEPDGEGGTISRTNTEYYSGHEDYINSLTYLLGSYGYDTIDKKAGTHTIKFSCHIPETCPSSYEGTHGHVRYSLKVTMIRAWKSDQKIRKAITILHNMDLNCESPTLRVPNSMETKKFFSIFPSKSQPVRVQLTLPKSGYVPGQTIPVSVLVNNDSKIFINEMKFELVMLVCYRDDSNESKNERIVLTKVKRQEQVPRNCNKLFNCALNVPTTPPTCLNLCKLIKISYQVELTAKMGILHSNPVVCIPVTIGTVPLKDLSELPPHCSISAPADVVTQVDESAGAAGLTKNADEVGSNRDAQKMAEANEVPTTSSWADDSNLPPPSYEEAVHMPQAHINKDEKQDFGQSDSVPRCPVYQMPSPTAPTVEDIADATTKSGN